jgi:hypothetical protein
MRMTRFDMRANFNPIFQHPFNHVSFGKLQDVNQCHAKQTLDLRIDKHLTSKQTNTSPQNRQTHHLKTDKHLTSKQTET